ncbi:MAG: transcriptional regulator [Dysgonamonadaceae bacterium]|jgi:DNA-binding MarR family transcriptional regulator|nr:transcriptional regulator [Dysgonamonadaceae bacterium]
MSIIENLNKIFDSRIRLGIMAALSVTDAEDFNRLKELLGLTDGNLASHLRTLEEAGYIASIKKFVGRKPNTRYSITGIGSAAFKEHIGALEKLLGSQ